MEGAILKRVAGTNLRNLVAFLNFDFAGQRGPVPVRPINKGEPVHVDVGACLDRYGMNNPRGFKAAAETVSELRGLLDPVVDANMDGKPADLGRLLEEVHRSAQPWRLEPALDHLRRDKVVTFAKHDRLEVQLGFDNRTLRGVLLGYVAHILKDNAWRGIRRCETCRKYLAHTKGRLPKFCPDGCRNAALNPENSRLARSIKRLRELAALAKLIDEDKDFDGLHDWQQSRISRWYGTKNFLDNRGRLAYLHGKSNNAIKQFLENLPEDVREKLRVARKYTRPELKVSKKTKPKKGGQE